MSFDRDAYLKRVRLAEAPTPDPQQLVALQRAHRLAIPFENLDIPLGRGIDLAPDALFDKLVTRRRGGYCFEQNGLFLQALEAFGFSARPLLARVWLGAETVPPRTHLLLLVRFGDSYWIADAGFGGSFCPPMPLAETEIASGDGARHRLRMDNAHGWLLERLGPSAMTDGRGAIDGWVPQYSFTLDPVWPADIAQCNHFTATQPGGRFVDNVMANIILPTGFASLVNRAYSRTSASGTERNEISSRKMLRVRLSLMFGIDLTADEAEMLWEATA